MQSSSTSTAWRNEARSVSGVFVLLIAVAMVGAALRGGIAPLPWYEILLLWFSTLGVVSAARWSHAELLDESPRWGQLAFVVGTTLLVDVSAILFTGVLTAKPMLAALWLTLGIHETLWLGHWVRSRKSDSLDAPAGEPIPEPAPVETVFQMVPRPEPVRESVKATEPVEQIASPAEEAAHDERVQSTMVRSILEDGAETVAGMVRLTFEPGEQSRAAHVGFVPSMTRDPEVEIEQCEGPEATLRIDEARCYGARIDVRLPRPVTELTTIAFEYAATAVRS
jgi:hypothetical protein